MKFYFDESLETEKLYEELIASCIKKLAGGGELYFNLPLGEREAEIIRKLSFNFVAAGEKLLSGGKNISFNSSVRYDQTRADSYYAKEAGYVCFNPLRQALFVLPVAHFSPYWALVIVPVRAISPYPFHKKMVELAFQKHKVKAEIPEKAQQALKNAEQGIEGNALCVAHGKPSIEGADEKVFLYRKDIHHLIRAKMGCLSYEEINHLARVEPNEAVGDYVPAKPSENGVDIFGVVKYSHKQEGQSCIGENLEVDEAGQLVSQTEGHLMFGIGGVLNVRKAHLIEGNLGENIVSDDPELDIVVTGNLRENFRIMAKGNVRVLGNVEGGVVVSEREIVVAGGVLKNAYLDAMHSIEIQFAAQSTIVSEKMVNVRKYVLGCAVCANGSMNLLDKRNGRIVGTHLVSGKMVQVTQLGSERGLSTKIELTRRSQSAINLKRREFYKQMILLAERGLEKHEKMLGTAYFASPLNYLKGIPEKRKERFLDLLKKYNSLKEELALFYNQLKAIPQTVKLAVANKEKSSLPMLQLKVNKNIHTDTSIVVESSEVKIKQALTGNYRFYYSFEKHRVVAESNAV